MEITYDIRLVEDRAMRGAVLSMALCVSVLIASEFMPVSLLSPIATDLGITEGRAGQASIRIICSNRIGCTAISSG
ncbi:MAG: hypothetical protein E5X98_13305, partial [Mesorhizobium sp.]